MHNFLKPLSFLLALAVAHPAIAQDSGDEPATDELVSGQIDQQPVEADVTTENAVTESSDAFGTQVGTESTGLYSFMQVRGFNPVDAGNVRLGSLYFDQVTMVSQRLRAASTIRVGLGTLGFAFPAPTGLVDYSLRSPGTERSLTFEANNRFNGDHGLAVELRYPDLVADRLGAYAAYSYRTFMRDEGGASPSRINNLTGMIELEPVNGVGLTIFATRSNRRDDEANPAFFLAGDVLPGRIGRTTRLSQEWADSAEKGLLAGGLLTVPAGEFEVEAGLFYNYKDQASNFADLMTGVAADGTVAERFIIADAGATDGSLSGELRISRDFEVGETQHRLSASLRGRDRSRLFGGAERVSLGPSTILMRDPRDMPSFTIGEKNRDDVRQIFAGIAYSGRLTKWLQFDLGASKIDYTKQVDYAEPTTPDIETSSSPIAWNAALSLALTRKLTVFGSVARGMEEADIAPDRAVNRSEAPAAINTRQEELVVSYSPLESITVLSGLFRISKPYYNLDPDLRYRLLGTIVNQGLEVSAVARPIDGLTLLGGAVISDPRIDGEIVDSGAIGARPLGQPGMRATGNIDWRLKRGESPLSLDLAFQHVGSQPLNIANTVDVSSQQTIDLGFRYRFEVSKARVVLRGRLENALNDFSWTVKPSGALGTNAPRTLFVEVRATI